MSAGEVGVKFAIQSVRRGKCRYRLQASVRRARRLKSARAAAVTSAALLLGACAPGPVASPDATPSTLPAGITVAVTQQRSDVADRQAEVQIHNGTADPVRVGAVRLTDPRFAAPAERVVDRTSTLAPGATVNVRIQLPDVACAADGTDAAASTVTIAYETGGRTGSARATADELFPFLDALHRRECVAQRVGEIADVQWGGFTASASGAPAALELRIAPRGGVGTLDILDVRETNLLTFEGVAGGVYPLRVEAHAGGDPVTVSLPVVPARCDPHAVQEDKRGTVFTLDARVDGEVEQFTLAAEPELKARLLAWVTEWCGDA